MDVDVKAIFDEYFDDESESNNNELKPIPLEYGYEEYGNYLLLYSEGKGEGFFGNDLYDLTFLRLETETGNVQRIDLDKSFTSERDVFNYFRDIDSDMFSEANVFGEIKCIMVE